MKYEFDHIPEEIVFPIVRNLWTTAYPIATIAFYHNVDVIVVRHIRAWMGLADLRAARSKLETQAKRYAKRQKLRGR